MLRQWHLIILQFWRLEVQNSGDSRLISLWGLWRESVPCLSPSFWCPLAIFGGWTTPALSHWQCLHMAFPLCLSVSMISVSCLKHGSHWSEPTLLTHFNLVVSSKTLFLYRVTFGGTGGQPYNIPFVDDKVLPHKLPYSEEALCCWDTALSINKINLMSELSPGLYPHCGWSRKKSSQQLFIFIFLWCWGSNLGPCVC